MREHPYSGTRALAAYLDAQTGAVVGTAGNPLERERAIAHARSYRNDFLTLESSMLGETIRDHTTDHDSLEIRLYGIDELEATWPGALQTTTFLSDGTGIYTRDATFYTSKAAPLARLYGVPLDVIHAFAVAHEYVHGQGVTDEREAHERLYHSLVDAIKGSTDERERARYASMLTVQVGELTRRYGMRRAPERRQHLRRKSAKKPS